MRTPPVALVSVAVLIATVLLALAWLATTPTVAPPIGRGAGEAAGAANRAPTTAGIVRVGAAVRTDLPFAQDLVVAGEPERVPEVGQATPAGVQVIDGACVPQPDVPVGLCTTERRTGRPCILPLGRTDAQGFLALPPHRVGLLVVDTAGGRIGSVARTAAAASTIVPLVLQATGGLLVDVVDAAGRAIDGARVELVGPLGAAVVRCDAAGRASFPQLALDSELTLRTSSAGRGAELRLPAHRPAGRTLHQVVVLDAAPQLLHTAVLDADGAPFGERMVRCTFGDGRSLRTTSDAYGRVTIPLPGPSNGQPPTALDLRLELLDARGRLCGASAFVSLTPYDGSTSGMPVRLLHEAVADQRLPASPRRAFGLPSRDRG